MLKKVSWTLKETIINNKIKYILKLQKYKVNNIFFLFAIETS